MQLAVATVVLAAVLPYTLAQHQQPFTAVHTTQRQLTGRFLHLTDFHPDAFYVEGTDVEDFCHVDPEDDDNGGKKPHAAKKDKKKVVRAGKWGPPPGTECDTPFSLVNATFSFLKHDLFNGQDASKSIDFVVWTGDSARHDNDNRYPRTPKQIYGLNTMMVGHMHRAFGGDKFKETFVPVVPTVGNNDIFPHNVMFAGPNSKTIATYKNLWKSYVPPEQGHTFDRGAYFHVTVAPGLAVVSLNTLYFYEKNKAVDDCSSRDEPGSLQLEWLAVQMKLFRAAGTKVYLIGHVPPSERQWYDTCYSRYVEIMIEYRDLVIGQLFGHVNMDYFAFSQVGVAEPGSNPPPARRAHIDSHRLNTLGANPLDVLEDLRPNYDAVPRLSDDDVEGMTAKQIDRRLGHLAVINAHPSIVPNYFPSFRLYEYDVTSDAKSTVSAIDTDEDKDDEDDNDEGEMDATTKKKSKKGKHGKEKTPKEPKLPKKPPVDELSPGYVRQLYSPLGYTQYFLNTTTANAAAEDEHRSRGKNATYEYPKFEVEYHTSDAPYEMKDLTLPQWARLANKLSGLGKGKGKGKGKNGKGKKGKKGKSSSVGETSNDDIDEAQLAQHDEAVGDDVDVDDDDVDSTDADTDKKKKKKKHKHRKHGKRDNSVWEVYIHRALISTGLEDTHHD